MSPRKSTSRTFRASRVSKQPGASSSKTTLDALPDAIIPESITPAYIPVPREKVPLTEPQRERLVHEVCLFLHKVMILMLEV